MVRPIQRWHLCRLCAGVLPRIALASLQASCCCCCQHCVGIDAHVALASLPILHWHHCLCRIPITASIASWHLPNHHAVATRPCTWHCFHACLHCKWPSYCTRCHFTATWPLLVQSPVPPWREGSIRGSFGAMIPFYLNWLVCGCFLEKSDVQEKCFANKIGRGKTKHTSSFYTPT
jgi:hypothetical protein